MDVVLILIRLFLFGVFALAGIGKLMDAEGSESAARSFGVPDGFVKLVGRGLPVIEIFVAILFLFSGTAWLAAIFGLLLILVFIGGMLFQIAKGNAPDCHCFGQIHSEPVGSSSVIRNCLFGLLALFLVAQGVSGQGPAILENESDMTSTILLLLLLAAVVAAVVFLKQIFDQQKEIIRRIDLLEVISRDGGHVEREEAVPPSEGLAIGSPFPEFNLRTLSGETATRSSVFDSGKPSLVFFVSPECGPCRALYPEIKEWLGELGERINFVLFSSGTAKANADKFGDAKELMILLQDKREVAELVKAQWTPTALFVSRNGTIASFVAAGDSAIRQLVDDVSERDLSSGYVYVATTNGANRPMLIGEPIPEFDAETVNVGRLTSDAIRGKKTLAVFWGLSCPHCVKMREEILEWEGVRGTDDPNLVVFADGDPEAVKELGFRSPVVLDREYSISKKIGMQGTPSAVVIDENGVIASSTAGGSEKIWALIDRRISPK